MKSFPFSPSMTTLDRHEVKMQIRKGLKLIKKCLSYSCTSIHEEVQFNSHNRFVAYVNKLSTQISDYLYKLWDDMSAAREYKRNRPCMKMSNGYWASECEMEDRFC